MNLNEIRSNSTNPTRKLIRDYLNNQIKLTELINAFDISYCDRCEQYELKEDLKHSINNDEICESCLNDVDI